MRILYEGKAYELLPIPRIVARCPECGGELVVQVTEYTTDDGAPTEHGIEVDCVRDDLGEENPQNPHRWWQGEWDRTLHHVRAWVMKFARVHPDERRRHVS